MKPIVLVLAMALATVSLASAQQSTGAPPIGSTPIAPPPAKSDGEPVQHSRQPNPGEVRPGNEAGDSPSAAAGSLAREEQRRILGLPVTAAIVIAGVLIALFALAAFVVPSARRRQEARGGGTYGRPR